MTTIQIVGLGVVIAGVAWAFVYPKATGDLETGWGKFTAKGLTQGLGILAIGAILVFVGRDSSADSTPNPQPATGSQSSGQTVPSNGSVQQTPPGGAGVQQTPPNNVQQTPP